MENKEQLLNYTKALFPFVYVVTYEETKFQNDLLYAARAQQKSAFFWSLTSGLVEHEGVGEDARISMVADVKDPIDVLAEIPKLARKNKNGVVVCLHDYHPFLTGNPSPLLVRTLRDLALSITALRITVVFSGPILAIPTDLEKDIVVVEYALPDKTQMAQNIRDFIRLSGVVKEGAGPSDDEIEQLTEAAIGLTTAEADNALGLSYVETKKFEPRIVMREKVNSVKKTGLLDIWEGERSLTDVGGLSNLKRWLRQRKNAFTKEARAYGLPAPKGTLLLGPPGTGKSLTAKACAATWGRPLLRLDAGKIFGGLVGESERNLRKIIQLAEAVAPVCLLLDEIEKAFAGGSSGMSDGGTSARVFGSFLTWMEEKTASVFIIATANDITALPPELLRKGRFDELWWIDLPEAVDRQEIVKIHLTRRGRDAKKFALDRIAAVTEMFSGAELEAVIVAALYDAFETGCEITTEHIIEAAKTTMPLARTAAEKINDLRAWAKTRTRNANLIEDAAPTGRRLTA